MADLHAADDGDEEQAPEDEDDVETYEGWMEDEDERAGGLPAAGVVPLHPGPLCCSNLWLLAVPPLRPLPPGPPGPAGEHYGVEGEEVEQDWEEQGEEEGPRWGVAAAQSDDGGLTWQPLGMVLEEPGLDLRQPVVFGHGENVSVALLGRAGLGRTAGGDEAPPLLSGPTHPPPPAPALPAVVPGARDAGAGGPGVAVQGHP